MEATTLIYILIAVIASLFIAVFQYIFKNKEKSQLNYWLSFFRFLSIFSILVLIINPSIEKKRIEVIKPVLLLAVDNSTSIKYNQQHNNVKNLVDQLKNDADLAAKFSIKTFGFGNDIYTVDSLNFTENKTNLALPFKEFSSIFKTEIAPVVLITDGNQTIGRNIEFENYKDPVYPVVVGDTTIFEDIAITQLNINKNTYVNNQLPVELFIVYNGSMPVTKDLIVYHNGSIIFSKKMQFSKTYNVKTESFYLTSSQSGTQFYTASIEALKGEKNTLNNSKNFSINVIDEQSNILILTSVTHPDLGMFKKAIESNKQRAVVISNIEEYKGNLSEYQLIITYQPTRKFKNIFNEIKAGKTNYFIVSGSITDWDFLNENQPYFKKEAISETENYSPIFNTNYANFISKDIGFSNYTPLEDKFGEVSFSIPYNALLFQKIATIETTKPLLATYEDDNQKGAILFGENIWRWRINSFREHRTFEIFDEFIANIVQYMTSESDIKRLNVNSNSIFFANEIIQISASYLDENLKFDNRVKLWLTISNKNGNFLNKIPFIIENNTFRVSLSNIESDEYNYTVSVENQEDRVSGSFKVVPFEVEQQFTSSNDTQLKILAEQTKGKIFYINQGMELIEELKSDNRYKSIQQVTLMRTPLIDWKWIVGFIILTLSIEWFTRKYFGRI